MMQHKRNYDAFTETDRIADWLDKSREINAVAHNSEIEIPERCGPNCECRAEEKRCIDPGEHAGHIFHSVLGGPWWCDGAERQDL
jgi:hypothetical protein